MKKEISVALLCLIFLLGGFNGKTSTTFNQKIDDKVRAEQIANMKFGMFICWSFSTFSGQEWTPTEGKDASYFKATGCNTDQWCKVAKKAGMGYMLFLAKHHDGFCLWDTKTTDKKVTNSPLGIDVMAKLRKSCDKYGIKLALYFSEGDWTFPEAEFPKSGGSNPEIKKAQLKELLTNYGPIEYICKGYIAAEFTYPILPEHKGGAMWFYSLPEHDNLCIPAEKIFNDYLGAVKFKNIFSIDIGPDYKGELRTIDVKTLIEVGKMIKNNKVDKHAHLD